LKITAEQARPYFWHKSQLIGDGKVDDLHDDGFAYFATGGVCGMFHDLPWPGVIAGHFGVLREAWGAAVEPAREILHSVWVTYRPTRIVGWMIETNRAGLAFVRRLGFVVDGRMPLPEPVIMMGWKWER
jgi:hypothetical protein